MDKLFKVLFIILMFCMIMAFATMVGVIIYMVATGHASELFMPAMYGGHILL